MLYGFKYTERNNYLMNGYSQYLILSELQGRYYIDRFYKDRKYHIDITDQLPAFCQTIEMQKTKEWHLQFYDSGINWFPDFGFRWSFSVITDQVAVSCGGKDRFPPGWEAFTKAINQFGDIFSEF